MVRSVGVSTSGPISAGFRHYAFIDILLAESARVAYATRASEIQIVGARSAFGVVPTDIRRTRIELILTFPSSERQLTHTFEVVN